MTVIGEAFILISPDAKRFEAEVAAETKGVGTTVSENIRKELVPGFEKTAKTLGGVIAGALAGREIRAFISSGVEGLKAVEVASTQTAAQIKATGGAANVSAEDVSALTREISDMSGVSSRAGVNVLLAFKNIRNEVGEGKDIFDQATKAAVDLSVAGFGSVESASRLLGRALNDPLQGMAGLRRINIVFTEEQKDLVEQLTKTGDILGAQKIILDEVTKAVGGSAEAYGDTLAGKQAIAQASMDRMNRTLAEGMIPALEFTADATTFLGEQFEKQPEILKQVEGGIVLLAGAVSTVAPPIIAAVEAWQLFRPAAKAAADVADISSPIGNTAASVDNLYASTGRLSGSFGKIIAGVGLVGAAFGAAQLAAAAFARDIEHVDVNDLSRDLLDLSENKIGVEELGVDMDGLGRAIERIAAPSTVSQINHVGGAIFTALGDEAASKVHTSEAAIDDLDKALANLAQRDPAAAAASLDEILQGLSPESAERLLPLLDDYRSALSQIEVSSRTAADGATRFGDASGAATDDVGGLATASLDALDGTGEFGAVVDETSDQLVTYEEKLAEAKQAVEDLFDQTTSSIDSQFAYRDSVNASEDALADMNALVKDGKVFTEDYTRSVDAAEEALFAQSEAATEATVKQIELAGGTADASTKAQIQVEELKKLRDQVGANSPLGKRLQAHIDSLNRIPRRKETTVDVLTGAAMVKLDRLARRINDILLAAGSRVRISVGGGGGIPLASGGLVPSHYTPQAQYLASGGGPSGTDTIPAWLTPGEFIMRKSAVDRLGPGLMEALNSGVLPVAQSTSVTVREQPVVQNIYTADPVEAAGEAARRHRALRVALTLR